MIGKDRSRNPKPVMALIPYQNEEHNEEEKMNFIIELSSYNTLFIYSTLMSTNKTN